MGSGCVATRTRENHTVKRPSRNRPFRVVVQCCTFAFICFAVGCRGPEKQVDPVGTVSFARPMSDILTTLVLGIVGTGVAVLVLRRSTKHTGAALFGLLVSIYLLAVIPALMVERVSINESGLDWTVSSWLVWNRHHLQWQDLKRVSLLERRGEKLIPGERGTPSKRLAVRFTFGDGHTEEWDDDVSRQWREALEEICAKAEEFDIPVDRNRLD